MNQSKKLFSQYNLDQLLLDAIEAKGFQSPTEIQERTLDIALDSNTNIVGKAQTGTGKTAAFSLPILHKVDPELKAVQALILCPTRELANQVTDEIISLKGKKKIYASPIYGGASYEKQLKSLKMGDQIIVGTPGRIVDHLKKKTLKLENLKFMVLDEADEMLNMGFLEDLDFILSHVPDNSTKYLFSATLPQKIKGLVKNYIPSYELIEVAQPKKVTSLSRQMMFEVQEQQKLDALNFIIDQTPDFYGIVFCRTKVEVDRLKNQLIKKNLKVDCLHGDIAQRQRERVLERFKQKKINILVATDVAARGIDIENLNFVINYHLPENAEGFVHRVGRTGRAGNEGNAITLVSCDEYRQFLNIQRINQIDFEQIIPPSKKEAQNYYIQKVIDELKRVSGKSEFYQELKDELFEEFEPEELILKLIQKAYQEASHSEFLPINKNKKSSSRGGGGYRRRRGSQSRSSHGSYRGNRGSSTNSKRRDGGGQNKRNNRRSRNYSR